MHDLQRDIGALEARMDATEARLDRIERKIDMLVEAWHQNKGGIRVLVTVGSFAASLAGALGAALAKVWPWGHE